VELVKLLKKYPKAFIYYTDNGSWTIYKKRYEDYDEWQTKHPKQSEEDWEAYMDKLQVYDGSDFDGFGYCSPLVEAMAEVLGMEVDSI
jgi:hypothetical protein